MEPLIELLIQRNLVWFEFLAKFVETINVECPRFPDLGVFTRKPRQGWTLGYHDPQLKLLAYNYWFIQSQPFEEWDSTVCHEMCHYFQRRIFVTSKRPWGEYRKHGELFYFLFSVVCQQDARIVLDGKPTDKLLIEADKAKLKLPAWLYKTVVGIDTVGLFNEVQDLNLRCEQAGLPPVCSREVGRVLYQGDQERPGGHSAIIKR
jgi:hypothetical protein